MKMIKEFMIGVVIIMVVIIGNVITIDYTKNSVYSIQEKLSKIKEDLIKEDDVKIGDGINEIYEEWMFRKEKLSYYLEHDELEKVEAEITVLKANIETKEYDNGMEALEKCYFLLEHIKDKEVIKLNNII